MNINRNLIAMAAACLATVAVQAQEWDTWSDTWVCWDELGRHVASSDEGVTRTDIDQDARVGIFYYLWHGFDKMTDIDISEILAENPDNPAWGSENLFHWGSTPWLGRYNLQPSAGQAPYIIQKHIQMLTDAGVDFLFFDCTNNLGYFTVVDQVLAEVKRRDALGMKYPTLCFMLHASPINNLASSIYDRYYSVRANRKYFYYYDGKPLMLCDQSEITTARVKSFFTFRNSWAWTGRYNQPNEWAWLEFYPQKPGFTYVTDEGTGNRVKQIEQISVSVAQHATSKVGKSYHNGNQPAIDRYGMCAETPRGLYFQEQWDEAIRVHPPIVMVTQFNEWIAQRFVINSTADYANVRPGATASIGESYFVDVYSPEFSRDLEPSRHPAVRDNYYLQLVSNVRKYRGVREIPEQMVSKSINIPGSFDQWDDVLQEFRDDRADALYTNAAVQHSETLRHQTNDIVRCKVTKDDMYYYFYVETTDPITPFDEANGAWMRLILNMNCKYDNGWCGYNFMVAKDMASGKYMLHKFITKGQWGWNPLKEVQWRVEGNKMHLAIVRSDINHGIDLKNPQKDFDFKWFDNTRVDLGDIMNMISEGDAAPNGRFNYRYKGTNLLSVPTTSVKAAKVDKEKTKVLPGRGQVQLNFNNNPDSVAVSVYTPDGALVSSTQSGGARTLTLPLAKGVYIVSWNSPTDSGSQSVMVK